MVYLKLKINYATGNCPEADFMLQRVHKSVLKNNAISYQNQHLVNGQNWIAKSKTKLNCKKIFLMDYFKFAVSENMSPIDWGL